MTRSTSNAAEIRRAYGLWFSGRVRLSPLFTQRRAPYTRYTRP